MRDSITTKQALDIALICLSGVAPVSIDDRGAAVDRIREILSQRGLKDLDAACDDTLPDFIDIVIDG